ncbi:SDR family NAD(P)-dependent oxidoreductase [Cumulibacter soli]|uniref:SDR family NAD(P)-dependent oxidoreductase n=1 Tax=Cumulibacter soli TaxID=2546344 RepID=UPI001067B0D7|nr:SDR family oxidoreductase [Cumulibacter soli]
MSLPRSDVLVVGATGGVGRELCARYAADGIRVHAVGRDPRRLDALAAATGALTYRVDLTDADAAGVLASELRDFGIPLAIAAIGGWYVAEPGLALPMSRWQRTIDSNLTAHFIAARTFAPVLRGPRPVYLALNGIASHYPCEGSLAISVAGVGQRMMLDVLAAEGRAEALTFAELVIDTPVVLPGEDDDDDQPTHTIAQVHEAIEALRSRGPEAGLVLRAHLG